MKSKKLLPIAFPPMAIENSSAGIRTILSDPYQHAAQLRPPRLDAFAAHTTCCFCVVDVAPKLATLPMAREVEFWYNDFPITER